MKSRHLLTILAVITAAAVSLYSQEIPQMIYYQGSLADASGKPVNGSHNITFSIWSAVSGGSKIWEETHNTVPVSNGLFSIILGSKNHITIDDFSSKQRYLQIVISGETLSPRQRIASVPYSHTAGSLSGSTNVVPSDGNAGIGITNPAAKLQVNGALGLSGTSGLPAQTNFNLYAAGNYNNSVDIGKIYVGDNSGWKFHFASRKNSSDTELVTIRDNGNVGIGTVDPSSKLQTAGIIHSSSGGFKFPDGSVQVTASSGSSGTADNLGNHTATQNLNLNGHWLSGDGGNEGVFVQNDGKTGIGINNPNADLEVNGTDGVLFTGTFESGSIPAEGAGTRMMWYPGKAAFRAGYDSYRNWDDNKIGNYSIAMGRGTTASGNYSTAMGDGTEARGNASTAMGVSADAKGSSSTAIGNFTIAKGSSSTALGYTTEANGDFSTALGNNTRAIGSNSTAIGFFTRARGSASTAMGHWTESNGENSTAMGLGTEARGYCNLAIGRYDFYGNSTADSWAADEYIFTIGDGTSNSDRSNLLYVRKNGNMWIQGELTENSDRQLKKDITPLNNSIDNLKQLNGVSFRWKDSENMGEALHNGIIAQDVEKVYPYLVGENEGYKTLNYNGIIPVLVEAVKELHEMNERQQKKIEALERKLNQQ